MKKIEYAISIDPLLKSSSECGDTGRIIEYDHYCFLALIDVLGHGAEARDVAILAEEYLNLNYRKDIMEIMNGLHECLLGSRGAVAALCSLDLETGELKHIAIGNITTRIFGGKSVRIISRDGIVGYGTINPVVQVFSLNAGDTLLLHSDGIKEHFDELDCIGLFKEKAEFITGKILEKYGKNNDDACCIALKYLK